MAAARPDGEATRVGSLAAHRRRAGDREQTESTDEQTNTSASASGLATRTGGVGQSTTTSSPLEALHMEEVERTRAFARLSIAFCSSLLVGVPFIGGDPIVRNVFLAAVAMCAIQSVWVASTLRDPARFNYRVINAFAVWAMLTTYVGVAFVGVFSITPMAVVVGIYFFGRSQDYVASLVVYGLGAGLQALLAAVVTSGAVDDPGIFNADDVDLHVRIIIQLLVQGTFFMAYALARSTRASSLRAIESLQVAMQEVSQREAEFDEVRRDLDNVLKHGGGGGGGRYTDQQVGAYKLGQVIGRGAMAEVYEGVHTETGVPAAVKLLHANVLERHGAAARFLREAQAAGSFDSRHAVRVLDASREGEAVPYLAMELLTGNDLAYRLRKKHRLRVREVVDLVEQVGGVIELARKQNIVHRDLKPQNLFLHEAGDGSRVWKILDFGMSTLGENAGTLTRGAAVGTPAYMAPEQARGKQVDSRADLYSLAAIAYRCLTGRAPFSGKDVPSLLYSVVYDMPVQPSSLAPIPDQLDDVLAVALAKKRGNRFQTPAELIEAFTAAARSSSDDWLQRRAEALILELPWGTRK